MADTTTTNYGLTKPEVGASEDTWGTKINTNLDTLDTTVDSIQGKSGAGVLKHTNNTKLATTSTGIDVTGTVTADKLVSDSNVDAASFTSTGSTYVDINNGTVTGRLQTISSDFFIGTATTGTSLAFKSGNSVEAMRIDSSGNVGIGKTPLGNNLSPALEMVSGGTMFGYGDAMYLTGNLYYNGGWKAIATGAGASMVLDASGPKFYTNASASAGGTVTPTERMRIDASGNVGIGTSSPNALLQLEGSDGTPQLKFLRTGTNIGGIIRQTSNPYGLTYDAIDGNAGAPTHVFRTSVDGSSFTERMRIDSSGRVGIGTSSPSTKLHLGGTAPLDSIIRQDSTASGTNWEIGEREAGKWQIWEDDSDSVVATFTSSGNVGIGTSSPDHQLDISGDGGTLRVTQELDVATAGLNLMGASNQGNLGRINIWQTATSTKGGYIRFDTCPSGTNTFTERMRIDSSGNVLVGNTDPTPYDRTSGNAIALGDGLISSAQSGGNAAIFNRMTNDGSIVQFRKDGTTVGSVNSSDGDLAIGTGTCGIRFNDGVNAVIPFNITTNAQVDNSLDLGFGTLRWDDIYATNGTIQTSDRNEKQDIAELSDAEQRVAVAAKGLLRKFRWKDSVAEKGDEARTHFGIIAQDLQAAFAAEGLDAGDYAMFISSTWTDEETNEEKTRMGVRYSELLAFIISAI